MSHEFTERDGMFTVRAPSWHGLETVVFEDYPTREQAEAIAHPWQPVSEPVYRQVPGFKEVEHKHMAWCSTPCPQHGQMEQVPTERYEPIEDSKAIVRSDTGATLGVVNSTYEPVNNSVMYDIAEAIEGEAKGSVMFETGGSLKGGKKVWLLIRLREPLVLRGDKTTATLAYYALQNAHDASGSFRGQAVNTRIVCDNTSQLADWEAGKHGTEIVFRHSSGIHERITEAKVALAGWREGIEEWQRINDLLLRTPVTMAQEMEFIERFIPMPPPATISKRVEANVRQARLQLDTLAHGETLEGVHGTAYALVQASVEYLNHYRKARSKETRFQRAYLERDDVQRQALALAKEIAHV